MIWVALLSDTRGKNFHNIDMIKRSQRFGFSQKTLLHFFAMRTPEIQ